VETERFLSPLPASAATATSFIGDNFNDAPRCSLPSLQLARSLHFLPNLIHSLLPYFSFHRCELDGMVGDNDG
jgi:hypothetical protein